MPKIRVEIIGENNIVLHRRRFKYEGNKIIIEKPSKGRGKIGYEPSFSKDSILTYEVGVSPFKFLRRKVVLVNGADKCVEWFNTPPNVIFEPNIPDQTTLKRIFSANVLEKAGTLASKVQVPTIMYVFLFMSFAISFLTFLVVTGRVRI